jgi:integrase
MLVRDLLPQFLSWNERHRSDNTVRFYGQRLKRFVARFGDREFRALRPEQPGDAGIASLEIDEYLHDVGLRPDGTPWSDTTRGHNVVALKTLQSWAIKTAKVLQKEDRIFDELDKPRAGRREFVPTPEQIEALLAVASPAFRQIYRALCQTGCRPGELCSLDVEDVNWDKRLISLTEHKTARKTGKKRHIPIGQKFGRMLEVAIGRRTWGPVFRNTQSRRWTVNCLSAMHRAYARRAGLPDECVLYSARHRFGTRAASLKMDILTIADLMGHSNTNTTKRYIHRDPAELGGDQDVID